MKLYRYFLLSICFISLSANSFSQKDESNHEWESLYNQQGVKIEFRKADCTQKETSIQSEEIYLKFTNTTDKLIEVDWQFDVTYGDKCYNCEGGLNEMSQTLKLEPKASIEAECGDFNDDRLRIFSKFINMENLSVLTDFHVKEIVVREISRD